LKRVLATLAGKEMLTVERTALPDINRCTRAGRNALARQTRASTSKKPCTRMRLVTTLRKRLTATPDEDEEDDDTIRRPTPDEVNGKK